MMDSTLAHYNFEIEMIEREFYSGNFQGLNKNKEKINKLIEEYQNLQNHDRKLLSKMKTILNIVEGKFVVGLI